MSVQFSVLGPVHARRGPAELDLGPNQQRAILSLLLVRANQLVTNDDLIELLWEQDPPGSALNVIQKYVGSIRRLLEPDLEARAGGRWLTRHGAAYRLAADETTSDLIAFRRMVEAARSAHIASRPADALDLLMEAVGLRRGTCGEGLEIHGRHRGYFTTVDQEYVSAVAEAADAALASAQPLRVLPLLRQVAAGEPLNESLQARLMLILAATGQQALALSHYQAVRERLSSEIGVDPGAEMRAAHSRVLRQELPAAADVGPAVSAGPVFAEPTYRPAISGASLPSDPSPLVPPAQLPADLPAFAGREPELSQVTQMLGPDGGCPIVAICAIDGMAGIGKTTFAVHWAHRVARRFQDGQLYLDLRGFDARGSATPPAHALYTLLCSLGVPAGHIPDGLDARAGMYRSVLATRSVLIVLDNARDARQVRPLLPGSSGCLVIVTSRNPLTGLAMTDGARLLRLDLFPLQTAREALERRLGSAQVAADPGAVEEIIRLCGRLPLALAIVAARAAPPGFTLAAIATDLRRTQGRLDGFDAAGVAVGARTVFSWSYHRLSPQACRLFRLLSLHPTADISAAASASLLGVAPDEAGRLIAELTSTALLTEHQPGRYSFHDLIRVYARELLESTDNEEEQRAALGRLLDHYLHSSYAAQAALKARPGPVALARPRPGVTPEQFSDYESAMSWFTAERRVLNASVVLAAESDLGFPAWKLAMTLRQFYRWRGFFRDWMQAMEAALAAAERDADLAGQGHVLASLAGANFHLNRHDEALRCLERAQAIYTDLGYRTEHAYLHARFGEVFTRQGKLHLAIEHSQKALELYQEAGYRGGEVRAIAAIGIAHSTLGGYQKAILCLEHGIALAQEAGALPLEGKTHKELGIVLSKLGQHDKAIKELDRALALLRRLGYRPQEAETLLALGNALSAQGMEAEAYDARQQALTIYSTFHRPADESPPQSELIEYKGESYDALTRTPRSSEAKGLRVPQDAEQGAEGSELLGVKDREHLASVLRRALSVPLMAASPVPGARVRVVLLVVLGRAVGVAATPAIGDELRARCNGGIFGGAQVSDARAARLDDLDVALRAYRRHHVQVSRLLHLPTRRLGQCPAADHCGLAGLVLIGHAGPQAARTTAPSVIRER
jgi:DNA-binding SARP family transcriptional activator/tetratricopeptide (TPR) repeat protein